MKNQSALLVISMFIVCVTAGPTKVQAQNRPSLGTAPISHIGIVVTDLETSVRAAAEVFGVPEPPIDNARELAAPDGSQAAVMRVATFRLPNFLIELQEAATEWGPVYETVQAHGQTVHHISLEARENFDDLRDRLVDKGGQWKGGTQKGVWAYVDFRETLGVTLEPITPPVYQMLVKQYQHVAKPKTLGNYPVTSIGIVVQNAAQAAQAYADTLGITVPPVRRVYLATPSRKTQIKRTSWNHENNITIELIEPIDNASPWSEALQKQNGNAVHHLSFNVGDQMAEMIQTLEAKGGTLTYGGAGKIRAYLDFTKTLGIVIELTGNSVATLSLDEKEHQELRSLPQGT